MTRPFLILTLVAALFTACAKPAEAPDPAVPAMPFEASDVDLAKPLVVSDKPADVALAKRLDEMIDRSEFARARFGVYAVSLRDGRVIAARNARNLFNPASVQKLLTAAVALDRLGADFRWTTRVFSNGNLTDDGSVGGDLVLYGGGAPDFDEAGLERLADALKAKGGKRINGDVVGDESWFTGDGIGDGWAWGELQWYYGAPASALTIDRNLVNIKRVGGGPAKIDGRDDEGFEIVDAAKSAGDGGESVGLRRDLGANKFYVWGETNGLDVRAAVSNPALWSARRFAKLLAAKGITVSGAPRAADWTSSPKFDPAGKSALASVESAPLGEIVRTMNKDSVNLYAELMLRTLGKKFGGEVPFDDPRTRLTRGDDAAGALVVRQWLASKSVLSSPDESIRDGSGLSRLDLISPETLGRALVAATQIKDAGVFRESLPVAGTDGTLRGRMGPAGTRIVAKTGSMTFVSSLAGYARRPDETVAFVIVCNDQTRRTDVTPLLDALALELLK